MSFLLLQLASGRVFFLGVAMLVLAGVVDFVYKSHGSRLIQIVLAIMGMGLVAVSATALAWWFYVVWGGVVGLWLGAASLGATRAGAMRRALSLAVVVVGAAGAGAECAYERGEEVAGEGVRQMCVIGDSLTAGIGAARERTWPIILEARHGVRVISRARAGATLSLAMEQARSVPNGTGVVVLEIGGNDLLGGATAFQFEADLENLLQAVVRTGRPVVMFELPLWPFQNGYGLVQRRLAARYGVILIPKRRLAAILFADGGTVDGLHLSGQGHEAMAELVWSVLAGRR